MAEKRRDRGLEIWDLRENTFDDLKIFVVKEATDCSSDIEPTYYSALSDSKTGDFLICFACGDQLNAERFEKYIEMKKKYSMVQPTCGVAYCLKDKKKRFTTKRVPKVDKTCLKLSFFLWFKQYNLLR